MSDALRNEFIVSAVLCYRSAEAVCNSGIAGRLSRMAASEMDSALESLWRLTQASSFSERR